ncbi:hypothetical protein KI811_05430 [Geobacter hydrogenophilus]|uniref:Uncharacterized protein n=1 Tax=Geobacter hydrogenophilus TaxID=40983 RepID=A0A9W6G1Z2_9BACT|nr:hypothetical protein [Geobacter hydrogenophilus]MBT0893256.1 hypothetical protein [Geobacter hydrogenophilus]GLI38897.1 hypothetical protein GHYDROH2_23980 [Geobacter hydrogenophilus]
MQLPKLVCLCCVLALVGATSGTYNDARAAEEKPVSDTSASLKEMPLLDGEIWQAMTASERVAFIWGIGHVVTMEREVAEQRPQLKKAGLAAKMAEGLSGIPMNEITGMITEYYKENPGSLKEPVMKVLWDRIVNPRIKAGFVDETKE